MLTASAAFLFHRLIFEDVIMMIATRVLKLRSGGKEIEIPIRLFAPQRGEGGWFCRYEIDWPDNKRIRDAWGVDSVQAVVIGLQMIGADVYTSSYHKSGNLMFEGPARGYGFPVPSSLRDLLIGDDLTSGI
jgi:hypothetical protein